MRQGRKIRAWMVEEGLTVAEVARKADAQASHTSDTIHGKRHHRRVLQVLLDAGCPKRFLALPEDMEDERRNPAPRSEIDNGGRRVSGCPDRRKKERRQATKGKEGAR